MKRYDLKIFKLILATIALILFGIIGYMFLLKVDFIDALYMTIITISTVGYGEIREFSPEAKTFSIVLIILGVAVAGYTLSTLFSLLIEGHFSRIWRTNKMIRKIKALDNHYIICGAGNTGSVIISEFLKKSQDIVIIDRKEQTCDFYMENNIPVICGSSTDEDILLQAGVDRAKGLISVLDSDVDNIVTVLTARRINEELYIISHVIEHKAYENLKKVGANQIISIKETGGKRIAAMMLQPDIISFLDVVTNIGEMEVNLDSFKLESNSTLVNLSLREAAIPNKTGILIIAVKKEKTGEIMFNPKSDYVLEAGDSLIVMGKEEKINKLRDLLYS